MKIFVDTNILIDFNSSLAVYTVKELFETLFQIE